MRRGNADDIVLGIGQYGPGHTGKTKILDNLRFGVRSREKCPIPTFWADVSELGFLSQYSPFPNDFADCRILLNIDHHCDPS